MVTQTRWRQELHRVAGLYFKRGNNLFPTNITARPYAIKCWGEFRFRWNDQERFLEDVRKDLDRERWEQGIPGGHHGRNQGSLERTWPPWQ